MLDLELAGDWLLLHEPVVISRLVQPAVAAWVLQLVAVVAVASIRECTSFLYDQPAILAEPAAGDSGWVQVEAAVVVIGHQV